MWGGSTALIYGVAKVDLWIVTVVPTACPDTVHRDRVSEWRCDHSQAVGSRHWAQPLFQLAGSCCKSGQVISPTTASWALGPVGFTGLLGVGGLD